MSTFAAGHCAVNGQTEGPLSIGGEAEHPVPYEDGKPMQNDR